MWVANSEIELNTLVYRVFKSGSKVPLPDQTVIGIQRMADTDSDTEEKGPNDVFVLPEKLTIALTADCFRRLMSKVEQGQDIFMDASGVERIDTAGIQLLLVVQQVLMEARNTLRWVTVNDAFRESVDLLGLTEQLALPADQ